MKAKARRQLTSAARAIASAGIIASFGLVFFDNKVRSFVELRPTPRVRGASLACSIPPGTPGQAISDAARSDR
jgi:hypothetical protein